MSAASGFIAQKTVGRIAGGFFSLASAFACAGNVGTVFGTFRYDDDFTSLRDDSGAYSQLKHIDLGSTARYISIGGDLRERMEYYRRSNLGPRALHYDSFLLHRLLMHLDSHW